VSYATVGLIDYGIGNHASVVHCLRSIGYRVKVCAAPALLNESDVLLLPGVGAFPSAMGALHATGMASYLQDQARRGRPIIGICLGMQLLATSSREHGHTMGLDIIPGEVLPLHPARWHIGWNAMECLNEDPLFRPSHGQAFYFNPSFFFEGPADCQVGVARHSAPLVAAVRRASVVGLQFHPEKSQAAGKQLLRNVIEGLTHA
jgi:glutamine amidotransferase